MVSAVIIPGGRPHSGLRQPDITRVTKFDADGHFP